MKIRITNTEGSWFKDELIIEDYPQLKDFGFELEECSTIESHKTIDDFGNNIWSEKTVIRHHAYVNINTIEELIKLSQAVEFPLIIDETEIEIYDGYRE